MPNSKAMRDAVRTAIAIAGTRGAFRRSDILEAIEAQYGSRLLSVQDEREAYRLLILKYIQEVQDEPLSAEELSHIRVPRRYLHLLDGLKMTICICPSGRHVLSLKASPEDWEANERLFKAMQKPLKREEKKAADIRRMLSSEGAASLLDLGERIAA
jgi:hypothetical protein